MRRFRKPHRIKKKKPFFSQWFFWLGILILINFGGIFYLLFFHSFFQIKTIEISGNEKISTESLEDLLNEKINQKVLFFFTKSIFLVNFREIKKEFLEKFPQVEEIDLKRKFPDEIILQIKERKPVAIFCFTSTSFLKENFQDCFYIDRHGIIFELLRPNEIKQDLVRLRKEVGREINLGEKMIGKEKLSKVLEVESKLKDELGIFTEEILVISEERFNVKTSEGWQIYFNFKENLDWQLIKLKALLEKEIPQEKKGDLEYIDVRFGNFAPYKYRQPP